MDPSGFVPTQIVPRDDMDTLMSGRYELNCSRRSAMPSQSTKLGSPGLRCSGIVYRIASMSIHPVTNSTAPAKPIIGTQPPSLRFKAGTKVGKTKPALLCIGSVSRNFAVSRLRSAMTSLMISASIIFLFKAQPNDIALKQRLFMFRGMPLLCRAIICSAADVNNGLSDL